MEEVIIAIITGVFGNYTCNALNDLIKWGKEKVGNGKYKNHHLEKAVLKCYYEAIIYILKYCAKNDTDVMNELWYRNQIDDRANAIKSIDKMNYSLKLFEELEEIQYLLAPYGEVLQEKIDVFTDKVVLATIEGCEGKNLYINEVKDNLLKTMSVLFANVIKTDEVVKSIFNSQLIVNINLNVENLNKKFDLFIEQKFETS